MSMHFIDKAKVARTKLKTTVARLQVEKKEEIEKTEERLKQQFMRVNERQKQYGTQLSTAERERTAEKAALEKELAALKQDLEKAGRKKACRSTESDDRTSFETWVQKGISLLVKFLGSMR
ncbi:hypothetical protein F5Y07DRAFT_397089 [Xylaria sp. FL0933]|nr:hypothetical protein F5Y07DRAFT_397089 [Xylaria sp. FL0933]